MALNLSETSSFIPNIRWMASTSTWTRSTESGPEAVDWQEAVFDLENIQTGWLKIEPGVAPDFRADPDLKTAAPKPTGADGEWKRGFSVQMFGEQIGGLREWTTNSKGALIGLEQLYNAFEAGKGSNPGKVPVIEFSGAKPQKLGQGHTSVPQLKISRWTERPSDLTGESEVASNVSDTEFA